MVLGGAVSLFHPTPRGAEDWKREDKLVFTVLAASRDKIPGAGVLVGGDRT